TGGTAQCAQERARHRAERSIGRLDDPEIVLEFFHFTSCVGPELPRPSAQSTLCGGFFRKASIMTATTSEDAPPKTANGGMRKRAIITYAATASIPYLVKNFTSPTATRTRHRSIHVQDARREAEQREDPRQERRGAEPAVQRAPEPPSDRNRDDEGKQSGAQLPGGTEHVRVGRAEECHSASNATTKTRRHEEENRQKAD